MESLVEKDDRGELIELVRRNLDGLVPSEKIVELARGISNLMSKSFKVKTFVDRNPDMDDGKWELGVELPTYQEDAEGRTIVDLNRGYVSILGMQYRVSDDDAKLK